MLARETAREVREVERVVQLAALHEERQVLAQDGVRGGERLDVAEDLVRVRGERHLVEVIHGRLDPIRLDERGRPQLNALLDGNAAATEENHRGIRSHHAKVLQLRAST